MPVVAVREQIDSDPENDQYELDMLTVPGVEDHRCGNTGVEEMIKQFRKEVEEEVRREPTQPFPALYLRIRSKFLCDQSSRESVVKGDILHSDGLRVILFSTEDSLQILSRAQTILADGTFRITPHLWYQTFKPEVGEGVSKHFLI